MFVGCFAKKDKGGRDDLYAGRINEALNFATGKRDRLQSLRRLYGKLIATLGTSLLDNLSSCGGRHPFSEAVSPGSAKVARVECQRHGELLLKKLWKKLVIGLWYDLNLE